MRGLASAFGEAGIGIIGKEGCFALLLGRTGAQRSGQGKLQIGECLPMNDLQNCQSRGPSASKIRADSEKTFR